MTGTAASRKTYVNLPVNDLARTTEFFTNLGFAFNPAIGDENTACMIISDDACAMLHVAPFFTGFTGSQIADTSTTREVVVGLSATSRDEVDELPDKAVAAGGVASEAVDQGFMYMRAFRDLDGHQWSLLYLEG